MIAKNTNKLIERKEVDIKDTWDLSALFKNDDEWEIGFETFKSKMGDLKKFKSHLNDSPDKLAEFFQLKFNLSEEIEQLHYYAMLKNSEDVGSSLYQGFNARIMSLYADYSFLMSFVKPELMKIDPKRFQELIESDVLKQFRFTLEEYERYRNHVLSEEQEEILSRFSEINNLSQKVFTALVNADIKFESVNINQEEQLLSNGSFIRFQSSPDREIRKQSIENFYKQFSLHKNTLAETLAGSVKVDVNSAKIRNYPSALEASLFRDNISVEVYDNLINTVHEHLPSLKKYYELRKSVLKIDELHTYDLKAPLISDINSHYTFMEAVDLCLNSLTILGDEYVQTLKKGLLNGWVDKYENDGKRQGAFSAGSYRGDPYILLNYQEDVFDSVFTLIHEAGHSMHSHYSVKNNPFQEYQYTIFVAEVASTFNEDLLFHQLMNTCEDENMKTYLLNKKASDMIGTIFRQTMFAEFEKEIHLIEENHQPLTVETFRSVYKKLLERYFSGVLKIDEYIDLECLRIPHFYNAFYVYKYATGLSAAMALSEQVRNGGEDELRQYKSFLSSGGSQHPLDQLKNASVDMTSPEPIESALKQFGNIVTQLEDRLL
ncbi:MAG: oligoendopeptidase F [Planctomycetota bacterium]|nr:MAG: oligoendopeptidase F [Planctomycetota bacterium]